MSSYICMVFALIIGMYIAKANECICNSFHMLFALLACLHWL